MRLGWAVVGCGACAGTAAAPVAPAPRADRLASASAPEIERPPMPDPRVRWHDADRRDLPVCLSRFVPFAEGSSALDGAAIEAIEAAAETFRAHSVRRISLVGLADPFEGDAPAREALGLRRAEAVKAALVDRGVDAAIIETGTDPNKWTDPPHHPALEYVSPDPAVREWERRLYIQYFEWVL